MNYYPHHIGDFNGATRHLTRIERSVYRDLIELYYDTERPLALDVAVLCRKIVARTDEEVAAVRQVLEEFFTPTDLGWQHARCEEEIRRYRESAEEADARRENERIRQQRHRERRSQLFEQLRAHGVVPAWDTTTETLQSMLADCDLRTRHAPVTRDVTATQEPRTKNQEPRTKNEAKKEGKPLSGKPDESGIDPAKVLAYLNKHAGTDFRPVEANLTLIRARVCDGFTRDDLKRVIDRKCREWKGTDRAKYLRPKTLFAATNFANYAGESDVEPARPDPQQLSKAGQAAATNLQAWIAQNADTLEEVHA